MGLAVGIAFFTLLIVLVRHELSYDLSHRDHQRIYRVTEYIERYGVGERSASVPFPTGAAIVTHFPGQVEEFVRLFNFQVPFHLISANGVQDNEARFFLADSNFFTFFDYPLSHGDPASVLNAPLQAVISSRAAAKYFPDQDPVGQTFRYEQGPEVLITGISPTSGFVSHINYDFILSFSSYDTLYGSYTDQARNWVWNPCWTYLKLSPQTSPAALTDSLQFIVARYLPESLQEATTLGLQPLADIHLRSHLDYEIEPNGDIRYVYIFTVIGLLILLITSINFANLSTARSSVRAKEIGIRKALGADRSELMQQFLIEAGLISFFAIFLAFILVELLMPVVADFTNDQFDFQKVDKRTLVAGVLGSGLFAGLLASLYPMYYLARFRPSEVLSGSISMGVRSRPFRSLLIIVQFVLTIFLLVSTFITQKQFRYLKYMDLGFRKEDILVVPLPDIGSRARYQKLLRDKVEQVEGVLSVTSMEEVIGISHQTHDFQIAHSKDYAFIPSLMVSDGFVETFGLELLAGRDLQPGDETKGVLINEEMVRHLQINDVEEAIGLSFSSKNGEEEVVGVVRNFNFESLHQPVMPFVLDIPNRLQERVYFSKYMAIHIASGQESEVVDGLEQIWAEANPERKLEYFRLSERINELYLQELKLWRISFYFSLVAILIACLGLFGLSSFVTAQRKKEVAIRKAIGLSDGGVMFLLAKEFVYLVGIAVLLSWPIAYIALRYWLEDFPFKTEIGMLSFLVSGLLVLGVTLLTVSYHTIRAGIKNPVEDLQGA